MHCARAWSFDLINGGYFYLLYFFQNTMGVMKADTNVIDTINEIIATGENCNLPYIEILGKRAKRQLVEQIIQSARNGK